jgi:hypothetical protein
MQGMIIIFRLKAEHTRRERARFYREFYGYVDRSNHGRYRYRRKGVLSGIPHIMPARSVIVLHRKDSEQVIEFLENHGADVFARDIRLLGKDLEKMGMG